MKQSINEQAQRLFNAINKIMRDFSASLSTIHLQYDLTKPQMITVHYIVKKNGCTMGELSKCTGIALSALTGIIDRMINKGIVYRERDLKDRRIVKVFPTKDGIRIANEYEQNYLYGMKQMLSRIDAEDRENVVILFEKISNALIKE